MRRIEVRPRLRLSVDDGGRGPAVFLLHGLAGFKELWTETLRELRQAGFRAIAYDHRGHGDSSEISAPWRICDLSEDLALLMEALGVDRACIVGHSMGGRALFQFALNHPGRTWAVVPVGAHSEAPRPPYREILDGVRHATVSSGVPGFRAAFEQAGEIPERVSRDPTFAQRFEVLFARNRVAALVAALDAILSMPALTPRLGEIAVPACSIVGERDTHFRELAAYYEKVMPRCTTHVIPGCHHYPMTDQARAFARSLGDFLRSAR